MDNAVIAEQTDLLLKLGTLTELLEFRSEKTPEQEAFSFVGQSVTFGELWKKAKFVSGYLMLQGIARGDRVVLMFENGPEFFYAFYGVLAVGGVAVPIFPGSSISRVKSIVSLSGARAVILPSVFETKRKEEFEQYQSFLEAMSVKCLCLGHECFESYPVYVRVDDADLAMLQYTSGSTGDSKGVMLSHRNLMANLRQMIEASKITSQDVMVSWLPVYHDLGLILMTMAPFYAGAKLVLLRTSLMHMEAWLEAIVAHGGTYTAAPDFAYRQVLKQVHRPEDYDLKTLRVAINAAEPVRAKTVRDFEVAFGLNGVIKPSYGLAEASVGVSFWGLEPNPIKVDEHGHVAVGQALLNIDLKILLEDGKEAAPGELGELVLRSPSATTGYFRDEQATKALLLDDGFVRTGDIAYLDAERDLFIVGRSKNVIKQGGRTVAPREIEELVETISAVRMVAALGIDRGNLAGEQVYIFAELRLPVDRVVSEGADYVSQIVQVIYSNLGFRPAKVYLVAKHTIPVTFNGKIKHAVLREDYLSGDLRKVEKLLYPIDVATMW